MLPRFLRSALTALPLLSLALPAAAAYPYWTAVAAPARISVHDTYDFSGSPPWPRSPVQVVLVTLAGNNTTYMFPLDAGGQAYLQQALHAQATGKRLSIFADPDISFVLNSCVDLDAQGRCVLRAASYGQRVLAMAVQP